MNNCLEAKNYRENSYNCAQHFSAKVESCSSVEQAAISVINFDVSDNEEQIVLMIEVEGEEILVNSKHCLYMLLVLARARMIDQVSGLNDEQLGWLSTNQFSFMLGCKQQVFYQHMLYFAQPWLQKTVDSQGHSTTLKIPALIEVDEGRIRFAHDDIQINCSQWCI